MNTALAVETPWYASWFDTEYYHQLYATRDESEAQRFVDALLGHLQPVPRARKLDVGCGAGRHSRALARTGIGWWASICTRERILHGRGRRLPLRFERRLPVLRDRDALQRILR